MHLSDSFYVALCMTILICGVVYWFWTQNQYVLRKLHLLNNIVFEMRAQMNKEESAPDGFAEPTRYPPAPSSVLGEDEDLLHETLAQNMEAMGEEDAEELAPLETRELPPTLPPLEQVTPFESVDAEPLDDLQPGGASTGVSDVKEINASGSGMLEGMTLKELRRLGEQRGISGAASMKKAALVVALREAPKVIVQPFEATINLS
jgi:hypothetical protein